jgi:hypothetical protein
MTGRSRGAVTQKEETMVRRFVLVVILLVVCWSLPAEAQSTFPVRFESKTADLPTNVDIINNLIVAETSTTGYCETSFISSSSIYTYCGDGDGCTIRLVAMRADGSKYYFAPPPQLFVINPSTEAWYVTDMWDNTWADGVNWYSGIHKNDNPTDALEITVTTPGDYTLDICRFHDDYVPSGGGITGYAFGLQACYAGVEWGDTTCTLTIED